MNIRVAIKGNTDNDTVQELIATSKVVAEASEGEYVIKALMKDSVTSIIKVMNDTAFIVITEDSLAGFLAHPRNGVVRGFQFPGHSATREPFYGIAHTGKGYKEENNVVTDLGDDEGAQVGIPFPLADNSNTVYHFNLDDDQWTAEGPQELMYGNVDWKGPKGDDPSQRKILTYKGNPSRYWPIGNFVEIPGLSSVDHSVDGLLNSYEYMTVFGDKVYANGEVLATMPWLYHPLNSVDGGWEANHQNAHVLGAAYRESDGVLFCIVKTCYNGYPTVKPVPTGAVPDPGYVSAWHTYKDGVVYKDWLDDREGAEKQVDDSQGALTLVEVPDPGRGYFVELIMSKAGDIPGGWKRLLRISTGSAWCDVNWFFSEDGTKACSVMFGELHKIEITGDVATHTTESLGGFKNTIKTVTEFEQESNDGEPDPEQSGIFGGIYRVGVEAGDWIQKDESTSTYTSTKSGTLTYAADYKGNELVKMDVDLSGSETVKKYRLWGRKWGEIASVNMVQDSDWTNTYYFQMHEPGVHLNMNGIGSIITPSVGGFACKPRCSVSVTNMVVKVLGTNGTGCDTTYEIVGCQAPGDTAEACITTTTTAANGTASRRDCVAFTGGGSWVATNGYTSAEYNPNGFYAGPINVNSAYREMGYCQATLFYYSGELCGGDPSTPGTYSWNVEQAKTTGTYTTSGYTYTYYTTGCNGANSGFHYWVRWWTEIYTCV